jgi:hypothetical protein
VTDVEISELEELELDRLDGVFSPANGVPFLLLKSESATSRFAALAKTLAKQLGAGDDVAALLESAIAAVAALIGNEAGELVDDPGDADDIETLLYALRALQQFGANEADEDEVDPMDTTGLTKMLKSASADELGELRKALLGDVAERVEAVEKDVEAVKQMAAPGGPVKFNARAQSATPTRPHLDAAREWREKAVIATDPVWRNMCLDNAREEEALAKSAGEEALV